ncbi:MAG: hypothetical protein EOO38_00205 [Cytophagaceae bacterium]|nr:MAG: hypothetical protein EOO38_00205 [Cytophagaceae bacterium]
MSDATPTDTPLGNMLSLLVMSPFEDDEAGLFLAVNYKEKPGYEEKAKNLRDNVRRAMDFFQVVSARMRSAPTDLSEQEQEIYKNLMSEVNQVAGREMNAIGPVVAAVAVRRVIDLQAKLDEQKKLVRQLQFALTVETGTGK